MILGMCHRGLEVFIQYMIDATYDLLAIINFSYRPANMSANLTCIYLDNDWDASSLHDMANPATPTVAIWGQAEGCLPKNMEARVV